MIYDSSRLKGLDAEDYRFFEMKWNLRKNALAGNVFISPEDEYVFRIRDSRDVTRGWHVRQPVWKGVRHTKTILSPLRRHGSIVRAMDRWL
jgi:hypothetical protein